MKRGPKPKPAKVRHLPLVEFLIAEIQLQNLADYNVTEEAGLTHSYISQLKSGNVLNPSLIAISSIAGVLGYELVLRRKVGK